MKKLASFLLAGVLLLGAALVFRAPLLTAYARFFTVNTATPGADAILVLSGNMLTRVPQGVELLRQGYAPALYLTDEKSRNARFQHLYPTNQAFAEAVLAETGVSADPTVIPSLKAGATSTFDEAYDARTFAEARGWKRIILVTDAFHTRRALLAFEKVFAGSPIVLQMAPAPNDIYNETNWWTSDVGLLMYLSESIKYPIYLLTARNVSFVRND